MAYQELSSPSADFAPVLKEIPSSILNTGRFTIMAEIYFTGAVDFAQLKIDQGFTDGAIAANVKFLEHEGFIIVARRKQKGSRQRTGYLITQKGMQAMEKILAKFTEAAKVIAKWENTPT